MHGIQVVYQCFHCLIGGTFGLTACILQGKCHDTLHGFRCNAPLQQPVTDLLRGAVVIRQHRLLITGLNQCLSRLQAFLLDIKDLQRFGKIVTVIVPVGLAHARCHAVIKIRNTLSAVLVILVGLNGNTSQCGIAADVIGLTQESMSGRKTIFKQPEQVNLGAGGSQCVKIKVVNMDIAFPVCLGNIRLQQEHFIELLGALRTILEHGAHGGITVNVCVFTLDIIFNGGLEGQILINLHQSGIHLTLARTLIAVQDICLRGAGVSLLHKDFLHSVLHIFHCRCCRRAVRLDIICHIQCQPHGQLVVMAPGSLRSFVDSICNLCYVKKYTSAVSFFNLLYHLLMLLWLFQSLKKSQ